MKNPGFLIWITGLAGSGKSTLGAEVLSLVTASGTACVILDGDDLRKVTGGIFGYGPEDRKKCAEFYSRLCQLLCSQGVNVICCTISMFESVRELNRETVPNYLEVFLDADMDTLKMRDQKKLYSQPDRADEVAGVGLAIEFPKRPDLKLKADGRTSASVLAEQVFAAVDQRGWGNTGG